MSSQLLAPFVEVLLRDAALHSLLLSEGQRVEAIHEDVLLRAEIILLDPSPALLLLLVHLIVLAVAGGLKVILRAIRRILIIILLIIIIVAIDDGYELL